MRVAISHTQTTRAITMQLVSLVGTKYGISAKTFEKWKGHPVTAR